MVLHLSCLAYYEGMAVEWRACPQLTVVVGVGALVARAARALRLAARARLLVRGDRGARAGPRPLSYAHTHT